jgi:FAD/FMN-containing dehydrogenase
VLGEATLEDLRLSLRGTRILPADPAFERTRAVWNDDANLSPSLIVRCADAGDVFRAVQFARSYHLPLAVSRDRRTVANVAKVAGVVVVDVSNLKAIQISPGVPSARIEAGVTAAELAAALVDPSLANCPGARAAGLSVNENGVGATELLSAEVVVADGRRLTARPTEHPDLFWAIQAGATDVGIVTSREYRLRPLGTTADGTGPDTNLADGGAVTPDASRLAGVKAKYDPTGFFSV